MPPLFGPGSFSTMKQHTPASVRAASATMSARSPLVTHIFVPSITYSSPSRTALHERLRVSLPASDSESDRQPRISPVASRGSQCCFCASVPWCTIEVRGDRVRVDDARQRHPAVGELLDHADVGEQVEPEPAVLLGDRDPEQPERLHLLDDGGRELVGVLHLGGDGDDLARDEAAHGLDHLAADLGIGRGSHAAHATSASSARAEGPDPAQRPVPYAAR